MTQKKFARLLKLIAVGLGIIGAVVYFFVLPSIGRDWASEEGFGGFFWPWLLFLWGTGIPCFAALFEFWGICTQINADNSFCEENAIKLKTISLLILGDVAYFFAGNVIFMTLSMNHPGIFLASLAIDVIGAAIGIAAAALSHLVYKAAALKSENDLTI
ncbi:MAG: DUF2975 domain-containing protein [Firmicutes bacterium]|nr:DUF2975 domain-containing protein [Bacillota bacterium]